MITSMQPLLSYRGASWRAASGAPQRQRACVVLAAKGSKAAKGFGPAKVAVGLPSEGPCPCGSSALYGACCAPYHRGEAVAPNPEALLRSRYSAYAAKDPQYIADTTHPDSPEFVGSRSSYTGAVKQTMRRLDPLKLTILKQDAGASADESFITFKLNRRIRDPEVPRNAPEMDEVTERSRFERIAGKWYYMESSFEGDQAAGDTPAAAAKAEAPKKKGLLGLF